ncbi:hypothetical protein T439DRAFT_380314 [Meredithblackwellia eburnea MCA 4105]
MAARLQTKLVTISQAWPKDPLRPTLQFGGAILAASSRIFGTPAPSSSAIPASASDKTPFPSSPSSLDRVGATEAGQVGLTTDQLNKGWATVESLERLLGDQAKKDYPVTSRTTHPTSFPKHYEQILKGVEAASRGETVKRGLASWFRWE